MRKFLILLWLLFISTTNVYSSDGFLVKKIYFKGLQRVTPGSVLLTMPIHIGDIVTHENVSKTIHTLFSTGNFEDIRVIRNRNVLILQFIECPVISSINFSGNNIIHKDTLKKILDTKSIRVGEILNRSNILNIKQQIEKYYYNIGKYDALITIVITPLFNNRVNVKFVFTEGISSKINKINIIGNYAFTKDELLSHFKIYDNLPLFNIINTSKYKKQILSDDLESLRKFYFDHGYARFNIDAIQVNLTSDNNIYITLNITEGAQFKLSNTVIHSNIADYLIDIEKRIKINSGELYNSTKIKNIENEIKHFLNGYGYIYPKIVTYGEIDDVDKTVKLYVNIDSGPRLYVRHVIFEGNDITKDSVLRREINQMENSCLNINIIDQGKERLYRLGYLENIEIELQRVSNSLDQVDVIYKVKERNTGSMNVGFGFGTESGANIKFDIHQDNWCGIGNYINLSGIKNNYQTYAELSMINPYLTINGISLGNKIFYNNFNANDANLSYYDRNSYSIGSALVFPIIENNSLNFSLNYVHDDLKNIKQQLIMWRYFNSIGINPKIVINNKIDSYLNFISNDLFLSMSWIFNTVTSSIYFPTSGFNINMTNKMTVLGSDNEYYKITFDAKRYIPITESKNWILIGRTSIGYSDSLGRKNVPFYDNFYAGGFNTIRGFSSNTVGPKAVYYKCDSSNNKFFNDCTINKSNDAIGGNEIVMASTELIFPIPFLNKKYSNAVRTSIFIDCGNVLDSNWENTNATHKAKIPDYSDFSNVRISTGISIQWMSPFGPLVFSYSYPLKKYDGDKSEQFQFNIGKTW